MLLNENIFRYFIVHFLSRERKQNQKKAPVSRALRVRASGPPPVAPKLAPLISGTQTVAASFSSATPMRDLVTKGDSQTRHEILVSPPIMIV